MEDHELWKRLLHHTVYLRRLHVVAQHLTHGHVLGIMSLLNSLVATERKRVVRETEFVTNGNSIRDKLGPNKLLLLIWT
jgi:hypothetical protein